MAEVRSYIKRRLLRNPDHLGSIATLDLGAYVGCVAIGLNNSFGGRPELGTILVALGLHTILTGRPNRYPCDVGAS